MACLIAAVVMSLSVFEGHSLLQAISSAIILYFSCSPSASAGHLLKFGIQESYLWNDLHDSHQILYICRTY